MPVCEMDPRPGGAYRHDYLGPEGESFSVFGTIVEIEPNRRIQHVEYMLLPERTPDNALETLFEPVDEGTRLTIHMSLPNAEARAAMLETGMMDGMEMAYASLDALLETGEV